MNKKQSAINQLSLEEKRQLLAKLEQKKKQKNNYFPYHSLSLASGF
ncbi:hypothetical protein CWATWH8502_303 [Crocosphaera watsonii WH 8502]|uniref:Uncharacterized protein n=4 Tax=Crocosphaera watsonii TaxID=263511 RepID=T2K0T5_CROWT|nr:hypothetical protein CWATWH0003_1968 [Crocosphaera watsonii WH 0003]CCQ49145.1 hypothetical protein CWATWH8502_303 [Crocosphaera watsonii WH 8502]CCQ58306.1 hypothetical protein CWATWH0005_361 [Crocosphaera watsonii WH 0005]CCQ70772.1 hypothetical protein CWATWH0402_4358 [Crocosphaera watsonii WH 0402]